MKQILILLLISILLITTACKNNEVDVNEVDNNTDTEIRDAVVNYFQEQNWYPELYSRSDWENATVKKITIDNSFRNIDKSYIGKEIYTVTIEDAIAAPTVFVDLETLKVIGIMPGE